MDGGVCFWCSGGGIGWVDVRMSFCIEFCIEFCIRFGVVVFMELVLVFLVWDWI